MEEGAAQLLNAIVNAKAMACRALILELFEVDAIGKLFRLRGLGGPQGIVSMDTVNEVLNRVIMEGLIFDGGNDGESLPRDDDAGAPGQE